MSTEKWEADPDQIQEINSVLIGWQQGDVLQSDEAALVVVADVHRPLTEVAADAASEVGGSGDRLMLVEEEVEGLVITSQTCDVIETCVTTPELTLSPIVRLAGEKAAVAAAGWVPRYAPVPGVGDDAFADLGRSTTLQKGALTSWKQTRGLRSDEETRTFQRIAGRNVGRFAFPDDMKPATDALRMRLRKKRDKDSFEGRALNMVEEIRMLATPDWSASDIDVDIYFLGSTRGEMAALEEAEKEKTPQKGQVSDWEALRVEWQNRCSPYGVIKTLRVQILGLDEFDARSYVDSDAMDLGGMSPN